MARLLPLAVSGGGDVRAGIAAELRRVAERWDRVGAPDNVPMSTPGSWELLALRVEAGEVAVVPAFVCPELVDLPGHPSWVRVQPDGRLEPFDRHPERQP